MQLLIDAQVLQTPNNRRGMGRYSRNLLQALRAARPGWRLRLVQAGHLPPLPPDAVPAGAEVSTFTAPRPPEAWGGPQAELNGRFFADWLTAHDPDAILTLSPFEATAVAPQFTGPRPPHFAVCYDLIPLVFADHYFGNPTFANWYARHLRLLGETDGLLAISEATAADVRRLLPAAPPVTAIGGATDPGFAPLSAPELAPVAAGLARRLKLAPNRPFLLFVGGWDFRKNMFGVVRAFAALPEPVRRAHRLVITCELAAHEVDELARFAAELGAGEDVVITGYVSDPELRALYQLCRLFIFPSLYEGFGLPIAEAMACGAPVVTSNCSSMPEYSGGLAWLTDPYDPAKIAETIAEALRQPREHRQAERQAFAAGLRWEDVAERAACALAAVRSPLSVVEHQAKPRIAWHSPLPPASSGISDYAAVLLKELRGRYEIDLVVDPAQPPVDPELGRRHRVIKAPEVANCHEARPYDLFLYHVGNGDQHIYMLPLLRRFPGLVVLHDLQLGCMARVARERGVWPGTLEEELHYGGDTHFAHWLRWNVVSEEGLAHLAPQNRRPLERAEAVLVHSCWVWQRLRAFLDVPVAMVPHAMPLAELPDRPRHEERARLGLPVEDFLVCSLGHVGYHKRLPSVLEAIAGLPPALRRRTKLAVVGPCGGPERADLEWRARHLGIEGQVVFLGRVPLEDFWLCAAAADVTVQLRHPTYGETSGALLRALAAGAVCVTANQGPLAEVPDDVALKVRSPQFEVPDLTAALKRLSGEPGLRESLSRAARRYVADKLDPARCAAQYAAFIDQTIERRRARDAAWQERACEALDRTPAPEVVSDWSAVRAHGQRLLSARRGADVAPAPAESVPVALALRGRKVWVEVTQILTFQAKFTGIMRTNASLVREWLAVPGLPLRFCRFDGDRREFEPVPREQVERLMAEVFGSEPITPMPSSDQPPASIAPDDLLVLAELGAPFEGYGAALAKLREAGVKVVPLVYDIIPVLFPHYYSEIGVPCFESWVAETLKVAHLVLTISKHSREDIIAFRHRLGLPQVPVEPVRLGDSELSLLPATRLRPPEGLAEGEPFVLSVGTLEVRKNHQLLYRAWRRLIEKHGHEAIPKLVLAGRPGWLTTDLIAQLKADPVTKGHLVHCRDASDDELIWLYRHCRFTCYPSFYEGWGLPIAESLSFGKFCIASRSASMPEIGGELCDYHDPLDLDGYCRLLERALFDPAYVRQRERRVRDEYRPTAWRGSAARVLELLGQHFLGHPATRPGEIPRTARVPLAA